MSEPLQKDQIVACWDRDDCDKAIRIYVGKDGVFHRCRLPGIEHGDPDFELWEQCVPLEELAPEAFLGERRKVPMSDFKIGQLVACRQAACAEWLLGIFDGEKDGRLYVRPPLSLTCASKKPEWFSQVEPAERIWPGLFLEGHRRDELVYRQALDKAHDQIKWLCGQLNRLSQDSGNCLLPAGAGIPSDDSCRVGGCDICWEQASLKAVEDAKDE